MGAVLVTGGTGFIGRRLVEYLKSQGDEVVVAGRSLGGPPADRSVAVGPLPTADWRPALEGVDRVVHLAARAHRANERAASLFPVYDDENHRATLRLYEQCAKARVRRFVFLSTAGVHGEGGDPTPITEEGQMDPQTPYAASKLAAEVALREASAAGGPGVLILRPPVVLGAGAPGNLARLAAVLRRGVPLPLAGLKNQRSFVYVGNLIDAIATSLGPEVAEGTYLVADEPALSSADLIRRLATALGRRPLLFPFPRWPLKFAARLIGREDDYRRLASSMVLDSGAFRKAAGWSSPLPLDAAFAEYGAHAFRS